MSKQNHLFNIVTALVIIAIVLLTAYILMDDIGYLSKSKELLDNHTSDPANQAKPAFAGSMDDTYYMVVFKKDTYYWEGVKKGFDQAGKQLGVRTVFEGSEEYDVNAQLRVFEKVVARKPKGIAVHPICADSFVKPINDAIEQGIAVTTFAADAPDSNRLTLVTSDNEKEGIYAADFIAEVLEGKGEIGIIERPSQSNHVKRVKSFMRRLDEAYPDLKVVARGSAGGDEAKAARLALSMIEENPGLDFIYCVAGIEGMGAGAGVKEAESDVKIFTYDADPPVIDMVKDGTIYAVIQPNVINQGYWSMLSLYIAANNLLDPISDWKEAGKSPLPAMIDNGMDIVTKENGDFFYVYD